MERRFARDFGNVRVHTDARAVQALGAQAVTSGTDIAFAPNRYAPATPEGCGLLAHELAHVVQQRQGRPDPAVSSRAGDRDERGAEAAVHALAAGRRPVLAPAAAGLHCKPAGDAPTLLPPRLDVPASAQAQSSQEVVVQSFLDRMWASQSGQAKPFRMSAKVVEGLSALFLLPPIFPSGDFESTEPVLAWLRPRLTKSIDPNLVKMLDRLPSQERALGAAADHGDGAIAQPRGLGTVPGTTDPRRPPAPSSSDATDAASEALLAALATFRATPLGRELEKAGKQYVLSLQGLPLVVLVTLVGAEFYAASDSKLPSLPELPVGDGITLKVDLSSKPSQLGGLLGDIAHDRAEPSGTPERKAGIGLKFTNEGLVRAAVAIGHFFKEAATWIAKGVVKAGTVIGQGAAKGGKFLLSVAPELVGGLIGGGLGAAIGAAAGGGMGALIGAGVGLAAGALAGLAARLFKRKANP